MKTTTNDVLASPVGALLHRPVLYDFLVRLRTLNRERGFREEILRLARIEVGDSVLDVGCGTGTLAIAAKRAVGPEGQVYGIDPSAEMLARAGKKATSAGLSIVFKNAPAQALPFPDAQFDVVMSTLMLHHLPRKSRRTAVFEMRRVLKPGGKLLIVDADKSTGKRKGIIAHFHRHGFVRFADMLDMLNEAGLYIIERGTIGYANLQYILATTAAKQA